MGRLMQISTRALAEQNLATHSFVPKQGYVDHGAAPLGNPGNHPSTSCSAPTGAAHDSLHWLQPPGNHPPMKFRWVPAQRVWAVTGAGRLQAHRLGYTDTYLSRAGWSYIGPAIG